jgi:hypothetical protein
MFVYYTQGENSSHFEKPSTSTCSPHRETQFSSFMLKHKTSNEFYNGWINVRVFHLMSMAQNYPQQCEWVDSTQIDTHRDGGKCGQKG